MPVFTVYIYEVLVLWLYYRFEFRNKGNKIIKSKLLCLFRWKSTDVSKKCISSSINKTAWREGMYCGVKRDIRRILFTFVYTLIACSNIFLLFFSEQARLKALRWRTTSSEGNLQGCKGGCPISFFFSKICRQVEMLLYSHQIKAADFATLMNRK